MKKAAFLDRDGIINKERGDYSWLPEDLELNQDVVPFLKELKKRGYLLIVITNQGGILKGLYSEMEYQAAENYLAQLLLKEGIAFDEVYYCPHHPLTGKCLCRKPGSLMIEKAIARFQIDASASFMVGDRDRDREAAESAGVKCFQVPSNSLLLPILDKI